MSNPDEQPSTLALYLQPPVTPARLARNRAAIESRLRQPAASARWWVAAAAVCAAGLVFAAVGPLSRLTAGEAASAQVWQPTPGAMLESRQQTLTAALQDGTQLELAPQTTVAGAPSTADEVELELRRGHASFDVTHDPGRQFRVRAGNVTVVVLGTRFSVGRDDDKITVSVERGKVAVERGAQTVYLTPGQRWEGGEDVAPQTTPAPSERGTLHAEPTGNSASVAVTEPEAPAPDVAAPDISSARGNGAVKPNGTAAAAALPDAPEPAKQLFEASREARRVGDSRRAAQLLQQLVAEYPRDPRAGLAAFELGRIRADVLGDLSGAITAFEQALRTSPQGSFRQDALARLAQAYDRAGRVQACKDARQRYLAAHGEGVHAQRVLKLCP